MGSGTPSAIRASNLVSDTGGNNGRSLSAWGKILAGYTPNLSVEITRECPLRCSGCYAYGADHLGGVVTLRQVSDYTGQELIDNFFRLIDKHRPLHISIVGGEPLVRFRELNEILLRLAARGIYTQVVTSAVRPIPIAWATLRRLQISVSIDGLQPEHDERRKPATYDRILKHIAGHQIAVHCTVTRQQVRRPGYLEDFVRFWSEQTTVRQILVSLYTPQVGETSAERLTTADRSQIVTELLDLRGRFSKLAMPEALVRAYAVPPDSPDQCIFANSTTCVSADFQKVITPCQFGGNLDCASCGCVASAGLAAIGRHRLLGGLRVDAMFDTSCKVGAQIRHAREALAEHRLRRGAS